MSVEIVLKVVILFLIITVILAVDVFLLLTNFRIKETIEVVERLKNHDLFLFFFYRHQELPIQPTSIRYNHFSSMTLCSGRLETNCPNLRTISGSLEKSARMKIGNKKSR